MIKPRHLSRLNFTSQRQHDSTDGALSQIRQERGGCALAKLAGTLHGCDLQRKEEGVGQPQRNVSCCHASVVHLCE